MYAATVTAGTTRASRATAAVAAVLVVWLALVFVLGATGAFVGPPGTPPLPMLAGFLAPLVACVAAYRLTAGFREFVLSLDLRLAAGIQAWRFAGLGFIALAAHGVLPGPFAWRTGLGDLAVGVTAPWVVLALVRRPGFAGTPLFIVWNLLGMLDLIAAASTGVLSSTRAAGVAGEITITPMAQLPLVLIPAYFVPVFFLLHLAALLQARQRQAAEHTAAPPARQPNVAA